MPLRVKLRIIGKLRLDGGALFLEGFRLGLTLFFRLERCAGGFELRTRGFELCPRELQRIFRLGKLFRFGDCLPGSLQLLGKRLLAVCRFLQKAVVPLQQTLRRGDDVA